MIEVIDRLLQHQFVYPLRISQFILALAIFTFAALMPGTYVPTVSSDHSLHFVGNTLLFLSASAAFIGRTKLGILALLLAPYSLLIEASQWLTPSRQMDIQDAIANMAGLAVGYLLAHLAEWTWRWLKTRRPSPSQAHGKMP